MIKNFSFLLLIFSLDASAWWDKGHQLVCDEAYKLLTPRSKKFIDPLIDEHGSYGIACVWPDLIKNEDRKDTRSWHYINLPDSEQNTYKATCPENGCLIYAFHKQMKVLNDHSSTFRERAEAVWFIGHFVGDVHQPMHVGYPEDRGGNDHKLKFPDGTLTNMHSVWDGQIIEHMDSLFGEQYLSKNVSIKIGKSINNSQSTEFESWAQESRDIAMQGSVGYRNNELKIVTDEYLENHFEIVQERIALGAIRLSQILNRIYSQDD